MTINNKELSTRIRFSFMVAVLVYLALLVLSLVFHWFNSNIFQFALSGLLLIYMLVFFIKGYNYIYFNADGSKIILRYMPLQPFLYGNYSIEIPKREFVKYSVKQSFAGMRTSIILYQQTERGLSKYRPISLSTLKNSEKRDLFEVLDRLSENK
jgi:hypothetical protein